MMLVIDIFLLLCLWMTSWVLLPSKQNLYRRTICEEGYSKNALSIHFYSVMRKYTEIIKITGQICKN